jgi:2-polyprenylphenol 6-hydroxylase
MEQFDVIVVGGGPVGASFARALRGLSGALVASERREPPDSLSDAFDARVYALSPGNVAFLKTLDVWQAMPAERLAPVYVMRVYGDDGASMIEFDAYRAGVAELAWIVEDAVLQDALWQRIAGIHVFAPAQCEALEISEENVLLSLRDGRTLRAKLIVGADGARSFVRERARIAAAERNYRQAAVVANFACENAHRNIAWQWFQRGAVLALLPLSGNNVSMVWSLPAAEAERVVALAPEALSREVAAAAHYVVGELSLTTSARSFALRHLSARRLIGPRVALAGDAGHVIHPLAGQGLNLGLQDARALAAALVAREPMRDPGDLVCLRRYERSRAEPILAMDAMVEGLFWLFSAKSPLLGRLRNAGLNLTDRIAVVKNVLMRQAMS